MLTSDQVVNLVIAYFEFTADCFFSLSYEGKYYRNRKHKKIERICNYISNMHANHSTGSTFYMAYVYNKINAEQRLECQCPPYC